MDIDYVEVNQVALLESAESAIDEAAHHDEHGRPAESVVVAATVVVEAGDQAPAQAEPLHGPDSTEVDSQDCDCLPPVKSSNLKTVLNPSPATLELALAPVRASYRHSWGQIRSIIIRIAGDISDASSAEGARDAEALALARRDALLSLTSEITEALDNAMRTIYMIPGFFIPQPNCKYTVEDHLVQIAKLDKQLEDVQNRLREMQQKAQKLLDLRGQVVTAHNQMLRRRAMLTAVRSASIVTLPFLPILSAVFSAVDMALSVHNGSQESTVPDDVLMSATESMDSLQATLPRQIRRMEEIRFELQVVQAKIEHQRNDPDACQVLDLWTKLRSAQMLVKIIFDRRDSDSLSIESNNVIRRRSCKSLREAIHAMHALLPILGIPHTRDVSLAAVSDGVWQQIEDDLVKFRDFHK
ncbi:hypothetical protein BN946_scf184756.g28, partial [Trametes cinnabarina]